MPDEKHLEILKRGVKAWNEWRKANPEIQPNLIWANLSGADLNKVDLSGANLGGSDLSWADLSEANLIWANLREANLSGADLSGAKLCTANLREADLSEADLRGADLSGADLSGADLSGVDLSGVDMVDEKPPENGLPLYGEEDARPNHKNSEKQPTTPPTKMPTWKKVLLWIAVLPGAVLGSWATFLAVKLMAWLGSSVYGNDSWLDLILREVFVNGATGGMFVYCGAIIAPEHKKITSLCFVGLILLMSGISIIARVREQDWMGLLGVLSFIGGGIYSLVAIISGEAGVE